MGEQRIAVVTGGNRGLGQEACRQLVEKGLHVVLASRNLDAGRKAAEDIGGGDNVSVYELDVTDTDSVYEFASRLKRVDVLINNAGVALEGFDADVVERTLEVNFFGVGRVVGALGSLMQSGEARIVMVSSGLGQLDCLSLALRNRFAGDGLTQGPLYDLMVRFKDDVRAGTHREAGWPSSAYNVSKVGLNAYTRLLSLTLAPQGITVNAVCPGWVRTRMGGKSAERDVAEGADTIVWAATELASTVTGQFFRDREVIDW